ncbi:MAG: hypothetical protein JJ714_00175 [Acidithiobacillus sp.]|nr:hypothetical protein [Acidithiobacillus sp.]
MAVVKSMDLVEAVDEQLATASPDVLRSLVETGRYPIADLPAMRALLGVG